MEKRNSVSLFAALDLLAMCLATGKKCERLADIESAILSRKNLYQAKIPEADYLFLWKFAIEHTCCEHFALTLGQKISPDSKGPLASYICSCRTLEEAINEIVRLFSVMNPSEQWVIHKRPGQVCLEHKVLNHLYPFQISERAICSLVSWGRVLTSGKLQIDSVTFTRAEPHDTQPFVEAFRSPVSFSATTNSFVVQEKYLRFPLNQSNDLVKHHLKQLVEGLFEESRAGQALTMTIERMIQQDPRKFCHMSAVESELRLSRQTIYRCLKGEGSSFREIVHRVRYKIACDSLRSKKMSVKDVAELLGYSDESSFNKSFKRQSGGISPSTMLID